MSTYMQSNKTHYQCCIKDFHSLCRTNGVGFKVSRTIKYVTCKKCLKKIKKLGEI